MGQFGFFDTNNRLEALSAKGDPLEAIDALVPWESFRETIETVVLTPAAAKKSNAGRKPIDAIVMFRMLILQSLYNLSDDQVEYQVRDRFSFTRFLKLGIEDRIPDGTTLWLFREKLAKAGLIEKLFEQFGRHLEAKGYIARGGQIYPVHVTTRKSLGLMMRKLSVTSHRGPPNSEELFHAGNRASHRQIGRKLRSTCCA